MLPPDISYYETGYARLRLCVHKNNRSIFYADLFNWSEESVRCGLAEIFAERYCIWKCISQSGTVNSQYLDRQGKRGIIELYL